MLFTGLYFVFCTIKVSKQSPRSSPVPQQPSPTQPDTTMEKPSSPVQQQATDDIPPSSDRVTVDKSSSEQVPSVDQGDAITEQATTDEAQGRTATTEPSLDTSKPVAEPVTEEKADSMTEEPLHVELITEGGITEETTHPEDPLIPEDETSPPAETQIPMSSQSKKSGKQTADSATQEDSKVTMTTEKTSQEDGAV